MRIIPAIDLLNGIVVHGIAGRRDEYRPLKSCLAEDPQPASIARGLVDVLGLSEFYIADLTAIAGGAPDWAVYDSIIDAGASLWIDAGVADRSRGLALAKFADQQPAVTGIIVGSESLADASILKELVSLVGPERLIFSLDLMRGELRSAASWLDRDTGTSPRRRLGSSPCHPQLALQIVDAVAAAGVRRLIVLDVAAVGIGQGCPTRDLCRDLRRRYPEIELTSGGGIRNMADVDQLAAAGCDIALVATALHDGRISRNDLELFKSRRPDHDSVC